MVIRDRLACAALPTALDRCHGNIQSAVRMAYEIADAAMVERVKNRPAPVQRIIDKGIDE